MTEEQIKHMRDRFLGWKLPATFKPDAGISYTPTHGCWSTPLTGTNLFDATEADAMVRYLVEGVPDAPSRNAVLEDAAEAILAMRKFK